MNYNEIFLAAECDADEECMSIKSCGEEFKHFKNRDFEKINQLKVCGVGLNTVKSCFVAQDWLKFDIFPLKDKFCCKVINASEEPVPAVDLDIAGPIELTKIEVVEQKPCESTNCLSSHPNFGLINQRNCGSATSYRISGGIKASFAQFPWMALLQYRPSFEDDQLSFKCGGSLITKKHVLTAAHCTKVQGYKL